MKNQNIIRVHKTENYSVVSNVGLRDRRLTYGARGLLVYLLTKPDNWEVRMKDLEEGSPAGREAVRSLVRELAAFGYIKRERKHGTGGKIEWETVVHEFPVIEQTASEPETPKPDLAPAHNAPAHNAPAHNAPAHNAPPQTEAQRQAKEGIGEFRPAPGQPSRGPLADALQAVCKVNYYRMRDRARMEFDDVMRELQQDGRTAQTLCEVFAPAWLTFWRFKESRRAPTPKEVSELWEQVVSQAETDKAADAAKPVRIGGKNGIDNADRIRQAAEVLG